MQERRFASFESTPEDHLIRLVKQGNLQALAYLLTEYPLLRALIGRIRREVDPDRILPFEEIRSAGQTGALLALKRYRLGGGASFITYAYWDIRGEIIRAVYPNGPAPAEGEPKIIFTSIDDTEGAEATMKHERDRLKNDPDYGLDDELGHLERVVERAEIRANVRQFVRLLPSGERAVVDGHYFKGRTHAELARERGVSRPAISKTMARAIARGKQELASPAA